MPSLEATLATRRDAAAPTGLRSLLVHVEPDGESSPRLHCAVDLARRLDATLIGVGAERFHAAGPIDALGSFDLPALLEEDMRNAEAIFRAKSAGLSTEWRSPRERPAQAVALLSRSADLIIAGGAPLRLADPYCTADPGELALLSGRPVLVVPSHGARLRGEAVVLAWKDTRECRRAVGDGLPFLRAAADVLVHEICHPEDVVAAEARTAGVVEHLRRHGVEAHSRVTVGNPHHVIGELEDSAQAIGADLIVAGAYGHNRMGEWLLGGVTQSLLTASERFVLMSH